MPSCSSIKKVSPFRSGMRPEAEFFREREVHLYRLFGWRLIVLLALSSINRTVFRKFHRRSAGAFAKRWRRAVVAGRDRLLSCNSETV